MDPVAPVPEITVPNAPEPEIKKDGHGVTIAAMAIFVLLSLAAVALLYYQNQQLKTMLASYQTATVSPIPTSNPTTSLTPKITLNNGTYTDETNKFTFKYPVTWKGEANCRGSSASGEYFCLSSPDLTVNPIGVVEKGEQILIYTKSDGSLGVGYNSEEFCSSTKRESKINCEQIKVNKETGIKAVFPSFESNYQDVGILKNGVVSLTFRANYNSGSKANTLTALDQILSTFKFVSPTASPSAGPLYCTKEAKICPDGSSVGRSGPNCEFAPCPTP